MGLISLRASGRWGMRRFRTGDDSKLQGWEHALIAKMETQRQCQRPSLLRRATRRRSADGYGTSRPRARRGRAGGTVGRPVWRLHPAIVFAVVMLVGLAAIAVLSIGLGLLVTRVVEHAWGIGAADERVNVWLAAHRTSDSDRCLVAWLDHRRRSGAADRRRVDGARLRRVAEVADRGVRRVRAGRRVGDVPRYDTRRPLASASRRSSRESAGQRQLPVRSHGGFDRGLRRPRPAAHVRGSRAASFGRSPGRSLLAMVTFVAMARMYRGMHHPLDVAGGVVVGIAAVIVLVFACRTAGAAARLRDDARSSVGGRA